MVGWRARGRGTMKKNEAVNQSIRIRVGSIHHSSNKLQVSHRHTSTAGDLGLTRSGVVRGRRGAIAAPRVDRTRRATTKQISRCKGPPCLPSVKETRNSCSEWSVGAR